MRIFSKLILSTTLSLSPQFAGAQQWGEPGVFIPPICEDATRAPVTFRRATTDEVRRAGYGLAYVEKGGDGRPYIVYDHERLAGTKKEFQKFVMMHECAHHSLDHTRKFPTATPSEREELEKVADCHALRRLEYTHREIEIIAAEDERLYPRTIKTGISWYGYDRRTTLLKCPLH